MNNQNENLMTGLEKKPIWRRLLESAPVMILLEGGLLFGLAVVIKVLAIKPGLGLLPLYESAARNIQGAVTLVMLPTLYYWIIRIVERRQVDELSVTGMDKETFVGLTASAVMIGVSVMVLMAMGMYRVSGINPISSWVFPIIWVPMLAMGEELIFRGIIFRVCESRYGTLAALIISAVLFGGVHFFNEHASALMVLSATLGGVMVCLLYSITQRLWLPIFFHVGWNFTQVVFGINVSGIDEFGSILKAELQGPEIWTGGLVGIENSIVTLVLIAGVTILLILKRGVLASWFRPEQP